MKLVKLDNNRFIWTDSYWHKSFFLFLIIVVILASIKQPYAQAIHESSGSSISTSSSTTRSSASVVTKISHLNDEHANMFGEWLEHISTYLYDLNLKYSGFKLLNETYHRSLLDEKDAKFAVINFTSMIMNISDTISDVLNKKTVIVKNLSEMAERAYEQYEAENDVDNVYKEKEYEYYNAKEKEQFCELMTIDAKQTKTTTTTTTTTTASSTITTQSTQLTNVNLILPPR
jgi:hypothetical protein